MLIAVILAWVSFPTWDRKPDARKASYFGKVSEYKSSLVSLRWGGWFVTHLGDSVGRHLRGGGDRSLSRSTENGGRGCPENKRQLRVQPRTHGTRSATDYERAYAAKPAQRLRRTQSIH
ncbi:hypothetical protein EVAR_75203_1 [Eumeta japonica]|uniref:Uncharacterized protein n=1 Tax=Eumeta variegata TaxID=151549 RepID=A0A4C1U0Y4_EUMVA|nr:hypothetical protein EVAR_75203_1 [Eumeta japonica]